MISNPVARAAFDSAPGEVIVSVGRLIPTKRFDLAIQVMKVVSAELPNWKLLIVGEGPERPKLEQLIVSSGMADHIKLVGASDDVAQLLSRAALFLYTSESDGVPNVVLEALSYGVPVVAFNSRSAVNEIVRSGAEGQMVAFGDITTAAASVVKLCKDADLREKFSQKARLRAAQFSTDKITTEWERLFLAQQTL